MVKSLYLVKHLTHVKIQYIQRETVTVVKSLYSVKHLTHVKIQYIQRERVIKVKTLYSVKPLTNIKIHYTSRDVHHGYDTVFGETSYLCFLLTSI